MESASRRLAQHVGRSAPLARYASSPTRLNRLHLDATGTSTNEILVRRSSRPDKPPTNANHSSPHCHHTEEFHRNSRSPPTLETLQTLDTRALTHLFSFHENRHLAGEHHLPLRSHPP
ncbi:hypothetical protein Bca52824_045808 [Brassica carinata]|uniref:Uncharacterized protein n=1 Tax=Brassica carinata TaxID=52824 RepID=A0A8X7RBS3_BRACI|nr:hypothetical protein Bca52824_045808 [Brassica carinata]